MGLTLMVNFGATLFAVVNPLGNLPVFVSFTADDSKLPAVVELKHATEVSLLHTKLKLLGVQPLALIQVDAVACELLDVCGKVADVL